MEPYVADLLLERAGENGAREILLALGLSAALRDFDRECATQVAVSMFECRAPRAEIRDRIIERYGMSRPTAYRIVDAALIRYLSQLHGSNETRRRDDRSIVDHIERRTE